MGGGLLRYHQGIRETDLTRIFEVMRDKNRIIYGLSFMSFQT